MNLIKNVSLKHISIHKNNLKTFLFNNTQLIGYSSVYVHKNVPIMNDIRIKKPYRQIGYGTFLLNSIENIIKCNQYDRLYINTWYVDRCYLNYLSFYKKRGYNVCVYDNDTHIDDGENIYYNLYINKKLG